MRSSESIHPGAQASLHQDTVHRNHLEGQHACHSTCVESVAPPTIAPPTSHTSPLTNFHKWTIGRPVLLS